MSQIPVIPFFISLHVAFLLSQEIFHTDMFSFCSSTFSSVYLQQGSGVGMQKLPLRLRTEFLITTIPDYDSWLLSQFFFFHMNILFAVTCVYSILWSASPCRQIKCARRIHCGLCKLSMLPVRSVFGDIKTCAHQREKVNYWSHENNTDTLFKCRENIAEKWLRIEPLNAGRTSCHLAPV